ncbi:hypothetical protein [Streptomyces sp. NPDC001530]|uniref:hypothetical protein n=1 Tax=Streptomyces sp. NPDC001530 TaxID=3364582 RepID=UPI00367ACEE7
MSEVPTRSVGETRTALHLIGHAEDTLAAGSEHDSPEWLNWLSPVRLAAFKGNTQLKAGHLPQARTTLLGILDDLDPSQTGDDPARSPGRSVSPRSWAGEPKGTVVGGTSGT